MYKLDVYTSSVASEGELGSTHAVVCNLMERYEDQNYIVFTDNFYISPTLADHLHQRGIQLTGTLRTKRTGVPPQLKDTN